MIKLSLDLGTLNLIEFKLMICHLLLLKHDLD